jgi:hypothetical protein
MPKTAEFAGMPKKMPNDSVDGFTPDSGSMNNGPTVALQTPSHTQPGPVAEAWKL